MNTTHNETNKDASIERFIYAFFVALIAYLFTNQLIGYWFPAGRYAGFLFIISMPAVVVLSALSFVFYKHFKARTQITWRASVIILNSLLVSVLGILITYPFVSK